MSEEDKGEIKLAFIKVELKDGTKMSVPDTMSEKPLSFLINYKNLLLEKDKPDPRIALFGHTVGNLAQSFMGFSITHPGEKEQDENMRKQIIDAVKKVKLKQTPESLKYGGDPGIESYLKFLGVDFDALKISSKDFEI